MKIIMKYYLAPFQIAIIKTNLQQGTDLLVQYLRQHDPNAGVPGMISGHGIIFHMEGLRFVANK